MTIHLYSTQDEAIKMDKELTLLDTVTGTARSMDQIGMEKTEFLLETNDMSLIQNANYMYVEECARYYFIGDKKARVNDLWLVPGTVDAIMSFKDQIVNCEGIVARSAAIGDYYIQDHADICYQNPHVVYKNFPNGFDGDKASYILITT